MRELTVSISNDKMHLQTLFNNATVAYLAAGLGIILMPDIYMPIPLLKLHSAQHGKKNKEGRK